MTNPDLNPIEREALVEFLKKLTPIKSEPLASLVAEEWAGKFYEEFYPEKPEEAKASALYAQFREEAEDSIVSALFEHDGQASENWPRVHHQYQDKSDAILEKLFSDPVWDLLGFAIRDLEASDEQ